MRAYAMIVVAALMTAACARSARVETEAAGNVEVTPVTAAGLPSGTSMEVRLNETIGTNRSKVGEQFTATVVDPIRAENGQIAVPAGATVYGRVTGLDESDHVGEAAAIRLDFERIVIDGESHPFEARVTATELEQRGDTREETLKKAGIGAAAGAVLGAVVGDADIGSILGGAAIGAAAGTVISLGTGDVEAVLPAGTTMRLQTTQLVSLR